ncbi:serine protease trypsin-like protein [Phytophthora sojae]|uniref:Serine protease trypsin-like protein n=1 Tax=Phytophthora sojae (strain P6497) TaxID=1094619 RepID=G5AE80_PHYSP|nr:serine protease trypsin-like protein [Phytophthora sojae]EGZ06482.1 serine protease trypsin-like protein [Phytophthora sojae]|eukprot:XP_009538379.1 serine protease trypsin-like protein [Phytophthora sojae]
MKTFPFAAVLLALGCGGARAEHTERVLVVGGSVVPSGTKTYNVGIRTTLEGDTFCVGELVAPSYVLTTAACTNGKNPYAASGTYEYVSTGTHYLNSSLDGEKFKIVSAWNHTGYNDTNGAYDFALLKLEKPSKFPPVKLPAANDSDTKPGMWTTFMGWGDTSYPNGTRSYELQRVDLELWDNEACLSEFVVDDTMVCAGGAAGKDSCVGDSGGPLIKDKGTGDSDDILVGLSSWGVRCEDEGMPTVYSRVSTAVEWINSMMKN